MDSIIAATVAEIICLPISILKTNYYNGHYNINSTVKNLCNISKSKIAPFYKSLFTSSSIQIFAVSFRYSLYRHILDKN